MKRKRVYFYHCTFCCGEMNILMVRKERLVVSLEIDGSKNVGEDNIITEFNIVVMDEEKYLSSSSESTIEDKKEGLFKSTSDASLSCSSCPKEGDSLDRGTKVPVVDSLLGM